MATNWRFFALVVVVAVLLIGLLALLSPPASAADNATANITMNPNVTFIIDNRIMQGQCVDLNSTIDISGLGWYSGQIDYFGSNFDDFSPIRNQTPVKSVDVPYNVEKARHFYLDPAVFKPYKGYWYVHYNTDERSGNSRIFYVSDLCKNETRWVIRPTTERVVISNNTPPPTGRLDERRVSDILLARGDTIAYVVPNNTYSRVWVFGPGGMAYDFPTENNVVVFHADKFKDFLPGEYDVIMVQPGANGIIEEYYDPAWRPERFSGETWPAIISPFRDVEPINLKGMDWSLTRQTLERRVSSSRDDIINHWKLTIQEPEIQINQINQIVVPSGAVWVNIRGYTNVVNGTPLAITFDSDLPGYMPSGMDHVTIAEGAGDPGAWRQFNAMFLTDFTEIKKGHHSYTVTCPLGTSATVPIYLREELPAHYVPDQYLRFIDNNPFIPTPTPIIQEKIVEKEVIKYETKIEKEPVDYSKLAYSVSITIGPWLLAVPVLAWIIVVLATARSKGRRT